MTRRGVYYDLKESPYVFPIFENNHNALFVFSSKNNLERFSNRQEDYLSLETNKLKSFYKTNFQGDIFLLIRLYKSIEKRGFLIYYDDKEINDTSIFEITLK